jgi:hypothetical protein
MIPMLAIVLGSLCWLGILIFGFQMILRRKEGVPLWSTRLLWNPFNVCFFPSLLTEDGQKARKRWFACVVGFFACLFVVGVYVLWGA